MYITKKIAYYRHTHLTRLIQLVADSQCYIVLALLELYYRLALLQAILMTLSKFDEVYRL